MNLFSMKRVLLLFIVTSLQSCNHGGGDSGDGLTIKLQNALKLLPMSKEGESNRLRMYLENDSGDEIEITDVPKEISNNDLKFEFLSAGTEFCYVGQKIKTGDRCLLDFFIKYMDKTSELPVDQTVAISYKELSSSRTRTAKGKIQGIIKWVSDADLKE